MGKNRCIIGKIVTQVIFLIVISGQAQKTVGQNDLSDSTIAKRLETIRLMLEDGKADANHWWYGWLAGYSAATVIQTSVAIASDDLRTRQDMALGAITTFLGAAGQMLTPMVPGYAPRKLRQLPEGTGNEKKAKLLESEQLLKLSALREKMGRSWKTHAVCELVNLGSGLVTWVGFDRNIWAGLGNFALNSAITEIQIFTQPTRAIRDYKKYLEKYGGGPEQSKNKAELNWSVYVCQGGVGVRVVF